MGQIKPPYIIISLRTREETTAWSFGQRMFHILWGQNKSIEPQRVAHWDDESWAFESCEALKDKWYVPQLVEVNGSMFKHQEQLIWTKKRNIQQKCRFAHTFQNQKGSISSGLLQAEFAYHEDVDWHLMFTELCHLFQPQLGMLHLFTEDDCPPERRHRYFQNGQFGAVYRPHVPGFGWMFAAGHEFYDRSMKPEVSDIDIERIDHGSYCTLQIAKGVEELVTDFDGFAHRRKLLMERLPIIQDT